MATCWMIFRVHFTHEGPNKKRMIFATGWRRLSSISNIIQQIARLIFQIYVYAEKSFRACVRIVLRWFHHLHVGIIAHW